MTTQATVLERFVQRIATRYPLGERAGDIARVLGPMAAESGPALTTDRAALVALLERHAELPLAVTRVVQHPRFGGIKLWQLTESNLRDLLESEPGLLPGLLYGFTLPTELLATVDPTELPRYWLRTLWRSVGCRLAVRSLANARGPAIVRATECDDTIFPAAMLLEIGKLILFSELKQTYLRFVTEARDLGHDLCQLELDSLGFDHRILATRVLALWSVPTEIVRCVEEFAQATGHALAGDLDSGLAGLSPRMRVLLAADCLAELLDGGRPELADQLVQVSAEAFGWDAAELDRWISQTTEPVRHLANCFGVELSEPATISTGLATAWLTRQTRARTPESPADALALGDSLWVEAALETDRDAANHAVIAGGGPSGTVGTATATGATLTGTESGVGGEQRRRINWNEGSVSGVGGEAAGATVASSPSATATAAQKRGNPIRWEGDAPREAWSDWLEDPVLQGQVTAVVESSRAARQPLSIILVQIDQYESLMFGSTLDELDHMQQTLVDGVGRISRLEGGRVVELGDARLGVLLPGLDRTSANRCGQEILRAVRQWSSSRLQKGKPGLTLSLGCAATDVPARNLQAKTLIEAAARCLDSVQRASGNGLKSIDMYY